MREFNYRRAWTELAKPAVEALSPELKRLWERTRELSVAGKLDKCDSPRSPESFFPEDEPEFRRDFAAIPSEQLAAAACALYYYGHWSFGEEGNSRADAGAYWRFEKLADEITLSRQEPGNTFGRWCSRSWSRLHWGDTDAPGTVLRGYMEHKADTPYDDDELTEKYVGKLPSHFQKAFVTCTDFDPHPFVIGPKHFETESMYLRPNAAPCYYRKPGGGFCGLSYAEHTHKRSLLVSCPQEQEHEAWRGVLATLAADMRDELFSDRIDYVKALHSVDGVWRREIVWFAENSKLAQEVGHGDA